jgi:hypothetical protein
MKKNNRRSIVDLYFLVALAVILIISYFAGLDKFLFKLPYITLMAFYFIGKFARDYEIKHYL